MVLNENGEIRLRDVNPWNPVYENDHQVGTTGAVGVGRIVYNEVVRCTSPFFARTEKVMSDIVIRRCPYSPRIRSHATEVYSALLMDFNQSARIENGEKDEFSVLVDGTPAMFRSKSWLPSIEEVEAAIQSATPSYVKIGPDDPDPWLGRLNDDE